MELASHASAELHLPYCVGGGFRSVADIRKMIAAGADKVSVNSAAVANPQLITDAARAFGTQAILCAIDAKVRAGQPQQVGGVRGRRPQEHRHRRHRVGPRGGEARGGGDSTDQHGPRRQPRRLRLRTSRAAVARAVDIPVIASGGVGKLEHFAEGIIEGEADAVLAASVFHFGELTVRQVKESMRAAGIPVRL